MVHAGGGTGFGKGMDKDKAEYAAALVVGGGWFCESTQVLFAFFLLFFFSPPESSRKARQWFTVEAVRCRRLKEV